MTIESLSASECALRLSSAEPPLLLDVRTEQEHASHRIPGSILIPLQVLRERAAELDPGRPMIVYCEHGVRSVHACAWLFETGFQKVANLSGGIVRWNGPLEGQDVG